MKLNNIISLRKRVGIIQSRGLGDIIIALPIAKYYFDRGCSIYWPIDKRFISSFKEAVKYVNFLELNFEPSLSGFLTEPEAMLKSLGCSKILNLYSYLSGTTSLHPEYFNSLKFDEYKYAVSSVPFLEKWNLSIKRNTTREDELYRKLVNNPKYIIVHNIGSNFQFKLDIPDCFIDHQVIYIEEQTNCIFDWLCTIEKASFLIMIDSCFSNLVDQLNINVSKMLILRSDVRFTPVFKSNWIIYERNSN